MTQCEFMSDIINKYLSISALFIFFITFSFCPRLRRLVSLIVAATALLVYSSVCLSPCSQTSVHLEAV